MLLKTRSRPMVRKETRLEWPKHLAFIARHRCCVPGCRAHPVHVHHLRVPGTDAAAGRKASDCFTVPVCHQHHTGAYGIHFSGNEAAWWAFRDVDPIALAQRFVAASVEASCAPERGCELVRAILEKRQ